jgi:uncharacterized membrane protein YphA (DoxX/SURF4 family)
VPRQSRESAAQPSFASTYIGNVSTTLHVVVVPSAGADYWVTLGARMLRLIHFLERRVGVDTRDLIFRCLFSSIFVGLGGEHLFDDRLIRHLMPGWIGYPGLASALSGCVLLLGGLSILTGYRVQVGARVLGAFLIVVTVTVHLPGCFQVPPDIPPEAGWLWMVLQRSNLAKNLCLFGVCVHLTTHAPGRFSVDAWLARRRAQQNSPRDETVKSLAQR